MFAGKKVLVTGGTGSFGHHIVDRLLPLNPDRIRIFSRDEEKQYRMRLEYGVPENVSIKDNLEFVIGDVRNLDSLRRAMVGVDVVFHAAALKQVPSCEYNVWEAIQTNTLATHNLIQAAVAEQVETVIAISTDKAVKPVNTMGMTKALQEKLITSANVGQDGGATRFCCVRYGNVLGSRGSVVPLFHRQILAGGPVTVTNPDMTRFILTLDDACDLIFQAVTECVGGEVFALEVPAVTIRTLAEAMIEGLAKDSPPEIEVVGSRPGEKMHEVLVSEAEAPFTVKSGRAFIILPQVDLPRPRSAHAGKPQVTLQEYSSDTAELLSREAVLKVLDQTDWLKRQAS